MTEWDHAQALQSGLLAGRTDQRARERWPEGARIHVGRCPACQELIDADSLLDRAGRGLVAVAARDLPPRPNLTALRARTSARSVPTLGVLFSHLPRFPASFRGALELQRTTLGVRAWDPEAAFLSVFAVPGARLPRLVDDASNPAGGVRLEVSLPIDDETRVVALSALQEIDSGTVETWLQLRRGRYDPVDVHGWDGRIRMAHLVLHPPTHVARIRLRNEPLEEALPEVQEWLSRAARAGRAGRIGEAAAAYQQAVVQAQAVDDAAGEIKSSIGLAKALAGLGFAADAQRVLEELVARREMDHQSARWIGDLQARAALASGEVSEARAWVNEVRDIGVGGLEALRVLEAIVAGAEDRHLEACCALAEIKVAKMPRPETGLRYVALERAWHLAYTGRADAGWETLLRAKIPEAHIEHGLMALRARAALLQADRRRVPWDELVERAGELIARQTGWVLPPWNARLLMDLVVAAIADGAAAAAWRLLRLRFLHPTAGGARALCVAAVPAGLLIADDAPPLRRLPTTGRQLRAWSMRSREPIQAGERVRLPLTLRPRGEPGPLLVASDGCLDGAPLEALLEHTWAPRWLAGTRSAEVLSPEVATFASLADVRGDLPLAAREVLPDEAAIHLRGADVTKAALQALPPVGLLHLGVHARRAQGVPVLEMADGPLAPAEIAELPLRGRPLVLLAGCATAVGPVHQGVERSLAAAFRQAGASAVIATRWPLADAHAYRFVRALVARWPAEDPAALVAEIRGQLQAEGAPPALWAAFTLT